MSKNFEELNIYLEKAVAYTAVMNLFDYDSQVAAPAACDCQTAKIVGVIADEYRNVFVNERVEKLLEKCSMEALHGKLEPRQVAIVHEAVKKHKELAAIPGDEYRSFMELASGSVRVWSSARKNSSFNEFAPQLEKIVEYKKRFASYRSKRGQSLYDVLLNDFEPDFTMEKLDEMFAEIKAEVIPLVKEVVKHQNEDNNEKQEYIEEKFKINEEETDTLRKFCSYISSYVGYDNECGVIAESAHPFTVNIHNKDVRITNNFSGPGMIGPIFTAIHETGHAMYEFGISDTFALTIVGEGTSMGMHEGQSRFYENMIGRQPEFWKTLYPVLQEYFPDKLNELSFNSFIKEINKVKCCPIRIDADELTYPLHIIIRYELEKALISGKLRVKELPAEWNKKYEEYLGVTPKDDAEGVLQDIHWATGAFGYFPSYAIGNAVAAQQYYHLKNIMPYDKYLETGDFSVIHEYLRKYIYRYGKALKTNQLLRKMMGEEFDVKYYIRYLKEKWGDGLNV